MRLSFPSSPFPLPFIIHCLAAIGLLLASHLSNAAILSPPTTVAAGAASDSSILVHWSAVTGAARYAVLRSSGSGYSQYELVDVESSGVLSWLDSGMDPDTGYYYFVVAASDTSDFDNLDELQLYYTNSEWIGGSFPAYGQSYPIFHVTTYYSPIESTYSNAATSTVTARLPPSPTPVSITVRTAWWNALAIEGWGLISDDPTYAGKHIFHDPPRPTHPEYTQEHDIRQNARGSEGDLVEGSSHAADPTILWLQHAYLQWNMSYPTFYSNGWGNTVYGLFDDVGQAISGYHLDFYVGDRGAPGSSPSGGAYVADSWYGVLVSISYF